MKRLKLSKKSVITGVLLLLVLLSTFFYLAKQSYSNPLPEEIKKSLDRKAIYPSSKTAQISYDSYQFDQANKVLSFKAEAYGANIVFSQQPAPDSLSSGDQVYYPALGIRPYAQFQSKLGPVALTRFWKSNNLEPSGQTAVMAVEGILLLAHPDKDLSNDQWKQLFDALKITR